MRFRLKDTHDCHGRIIELNDSRDNTVVRIFHWNGRDEKLPTGPRIEMYFNQPLVPRTNRCDFDLSEADSDYFEAGAAVSPPEAVLDLVAELMPDSWLRDLLATSTVTV